MSLGDAEHPISFRFEPHTIDGHVRVVVRSGIRGMRASAGFLLFRPEEWAAFREVLDRSNHDEDLAAVLRATIPTDLRENPHRLDYHSRVILHAGRGVHVVHVDETPFEISTDEDEG